MRLHRGSHFNNLEVQVGDEVRSRYRAPWRGTVISEQWTKDTYGQHRLVEVGVHTDRNGHPMRKRLKKWLSPSWLVKV